MKCAGKWIVALAASAALVGCGDEDGGGGGAGSGTVAEPWTTYCVATFTEDYTFIDPFGDVDLEVQAGEAYLMGDYRTFAGELRADILYLTSAGPVEFTAELAAGETPPFTTDCEVDANQHNLGVFADTTLYGDEALTEEICQLPAGTIVENQGTSYALVGEIDFLGTSPSTYRVTLGGLSERCGGGEEAFVSAPWVKVGSTNHSVVPLKGFLAPTPAPSQ